MSENKKRVLVVGAGGFAGGFIVDEALKRGYETWAGVRATTSRRYLTDPRIRFIVFDFDDPASIVKAINEALADGERWDYIVYNLGATKVVTYTDFAKINYEYLRSFTGALHTAGRIPDKLLYISSLSVMGPRDERGYSDAREDMVPMPNTRYATSKLKAEMWLQTCGIPYIIFRATGIYGPRDHDYFLMFKYMSMGFDFGAGFRRQKLTFIYVEDLARAVYDALERAAVGEVYNVAEPRSYTQKEFRIISKRVMNKRFVMPLRLPLWIVKVVSAIAEKWGVLRMKPSTLNRDKYRIMKQRNWGAEISKAQTVFGFDPQVDLEEGVKRSVEWYRKEGWMK
jgi:nucleoside-diphosphate-sugar epimerase